MHFESLGMNRTRSRASRGPGKGGGQGGAEGVAQGGGQSGGWHRGAGRVERSTARAGREGGVAQVDGQESNAARQGRGGAWNGLDCGAMDGQVSNGGRD
jgi:hypothetical protein